MFYSKNILAAIFLFSCLSFSGPFHRDNLIEWSADKPLKWEYFKGKPDKSSSFNALTNSGITYSTQASDAGTYEFNVICYFDTKSSWVKKGYEDEQLLKHEQVHFNITEVYARKLRKELKSNIFNPENVEKESRVLFNRIFSESKKEQQLYDKETQHGKAEDKQTAWEEKVKKLLTEFDAFKKI